MSENRFGTIVEIEEEETEQVPEYSFDLTKMELTTNIAELTQEGNYLVGTTDKGVKFRQRIPQGKILNKVNGKFVLQDMEIA